MVIHAGRNYGNTTHLADGLLKALGIINVGNLKFQVMEIDPETLIWSYIKGGTLWKSVFNKKGEGR